MTDKQKEQIRITGRNVMFPSLPLADARLTSIDVHVYAILAMTESTDIESSREGWFMISQGAVAAFVGKNRSTVNRAIGKLTDLGYLEKKSQIGRGGQGHNLYRVKFDQTATIPPAYDRHKTVLDDTGQPDLPLLSVDDQEDGPGGGAAEAMEKTKEIRGVLPVHTAENKGVRAETADSRAVAPAHTAVQQDDTADSRAVVPAHSQDSSGVQLPLIESESKNYDSNSINCPERRAVASGAGLSTDPGDADRIVDYFLHLRGNLFGTGGPLSGRAKLLDAAVKAMSLGLDAEQVMSVIRNRMNALSNSDSGKTPATLWMFRHDFEKQAKMDGPKVETEVLAARGPRGCSSNTTNRGTTAGTPTIPDASDHRDEFVDLAKAEDASANPWLSNIADVRQAGEKVSVIVSSRMVEMSISDNAETMDALTRAARKMFGVTTIVIERGHVRVSERKMVTA